LLLLLMMMMMMRKCEHSDVSRSDNNRIGWDRQGSRQVKEEEEGGDNFLIEFQGQSSSRPSHHRETMWARHDHFEYPPVLIFVLNEKRIKAFLYQTCWTENKKTRKNGDDDGGKYYVCRTRIKIQGARIVRIVSLGFSPAQRRRRRRRIWRSLNFPRRAIIESLYNTTNGPILLPIIKLLFQMQRCA
jgi:hypothetical protein